MVHGSVEMLGGAEGRQPMSGAAPEQQGASGVSAGKELGPSQKSVGMCP